MDGHLNNAFDQSKIDRELSRQAAVLAKDRESSQRFMPAWPPESLIDVMIPPVSGLAMINTVKFDQRQTRIRTGWEATPTARPHGPVMEVLMPPMSGPILIKSATATGGTGGILDQTAAQSVSRVVFQLIQNDQIGSARKVLNSLPVGYVNQSLVDKIRKILAPPTTKASPRRDADRQQDYLWLRDHAEDYRGQWVALDEGRLVANASSLRELLDRVKQLELRTRPLLHCITS